MDLVGPRGVLAAVEVDHGHDQPAPDHEHRDEHEDDALVFMSVASGLGGVGDGVERGLRSPPDARGEEAEDDHGRGGAPPEGEQHPLPGSPRTASRGRSRKASTRT